MYIYKFKKYIIIYNYIYIYLRSGNFKEDFVTGEFLFEECYEMLNFLVPQISLPSRIQGKRQSLPTILVSKIVKSPNELHASLAMHQPLELPFVVLKPEPRKNKRT